VELTRVALDCGGSLEDVLDALDALDLHLVAGFQRIALHVLKVDEGLLAVVDFEFAALHVFLDVADVRLELAFLDDRDVEFLLESVDHGLLLADHGGLGVALLELFGVEAVDHGLELVVVFAEGGLADFLLLLRLLELLVGFVEFVGERLDLGRCVVGGLELLAALVFALEDLGFGLDEVLLGELVELPAPHDVVGPVEDLVHLLFGEALHS